MSPYAFACGVKQRDILALVEGEIAPGKRGLTDCGHATSLTEQTASDRWRQADVDGSFLAGESSSDRLPEPLDVFPAPTWRPTG